MRHLRILAPLLAAVLLTTACGADPTPDADELSAVKKQIRLLEQERSDLKKQIIEPSFSLHPDPVCILCFDGAYASVGEIAFPLLQEFDYPAVITVRPDTLPGEDGMITTDQARELIAAGWEFIPAGDLDIPVNLDGQLNPDWISDLDRTLANFRTIGLPAPSCFAFASDTYDPLADQALADRGFTAALHRWSDSTIRNEKLEAYGIDALGREISDGNPVYRIGGATICAGESTAQTNVRAACAENAVAAVCTGQVKTEVPDDDRNMDCTESKYRMMLGDIAAYAEEYGLRLLTFSEVCRYRRDSEEQLDERQAEYEAFCLSAKARMDEIEQEIAAILRQRLEE